MPLRVNTRLIARSGNARRGRAMRDRIGEFWVGGVVVEDEWVFSGVSRRVLVRTRGIFLAFSAKPSNHTQNPVTLTRASAEGLPCPSTRDGPTTIPSISSFTFTHLGPAE